jgi:ubiquinone/menaquinone biosynthesis C-methylase UbiE
MDAAKLEQLVGKMISDLGAAAVGALVLIGDKLGLYEALAQGPATSGELAERTGTNERYVREWLSAQVASGYIEHDATEGKFSMSPEQIAVFADRESDHIMTGGYYSVRSLYLDEPTLTKAFQTGRGVGWHEHSPCLFCGTERFFGPVYRSELVENWLPALEGVVEKLKRGAKVADVGCGHGRSTHLMAKAFPKSRFLGFDYHDGSIERARELAKAEGVTNIEFHVAPAKTFPGNEFDLVTFFDCLHDMGDPAGAARHVREALQPDGTWMIVEPLAGDRLEDNLNPVSRVYYAFSAMVCTPASRAQEVGLALGAQAGEARLRSVIESAGFTRIRRAAQTATNMVLEARR